MVGSFLVQISEAKRYIDGFVMHALGYLMNWLS